VELHLRRVGTENGQDRAGMVRPHVIEVVEEPRPHERRGDDQVTADLQSVKVRIEEAQQIMRRKVLDDVRHQEHVEAVVSGLELLNGQALQIRVARRLDQLRVDVDPDHVQPLVGEPPKVAAEPAADVEDGLIRAQAQAAHEPGQDGAFVEAVHDAIPRPGPADPADDGRGFRQ
jgi:hypothetical protein